jgi:crossover junction endodeoxyribonuclease RuvC
LPRSTLNRARIVVLGVDPGTLVTGFGVIAAGAGRTEVLACGAIRNGGATPMALRLKAIYASLIDVIEEYRPDEFAVETAFYGKNAQSALKLGQARGVAMLAAVNRDLPASEYSPREVKQAIVGNGNASKEQVQYMVRTLLALKEPPRPFDVSDALAVALCHLHRKQAGRPKSVSWKSFVDAHPEAVSSPRRAAAR